MTDIVERLRSPEFADVAEKYLMFEAADEIERLRVALQRISSMVPDHGSFDSINGFEMGMIARRALDGEKG